MSCGYGSEAFTFVAHFTKAKASHINHSQIMHEGARRSQLVKDVPRRFLVHLLWMNRCNSPKGCPRKVMNEQGQRWTIVDTTSLSEEFSASFPQVAGQIGLCGDSGDEPPLTGPGQAK